ncbi:MAG: ferric reductase-like transmembrane domain-containing protein [Rubripirellula sp.]
MSSSKFTNLLICINASIPLAILGLDYWNQNLGANAVNTAIHITGIVSLVLLLLSLAVTPIIRVTHQKHWFAARKTFGLFGFFYAVVHLTIYFFLDREGDVSSLVHEMATRRFLLVGTLAIVLLLPLALTSTQRMRKRLGFKKWKRLHRLAYLIAVLVVLHYYMEVKSDTQSPIAFAVVLGFILASRIPFRGTANNPNVDPENQRVIKTKSKWSGDLILTQIRNDSHNVKSFRLAPNDRDRLPFRFLAGQFINLTLNDNSAPLQRSYTIASSPHQLDWIEISVKKEPSGKGSGYLHESSNVGDVFQVNGPHGKFFFDADLTRRLILIAGGVGITPIMSMIRFIRDINWQGEVNVLLSAKTESDLLFNDELREIRQLHKNISIEQTLTQNSNSNWTGRTGRIDPETIRKMEPDQDGTHVFICGPNAMADEISSMVLETGINPRNLHRESFGGRRSGSVRFDTTDQETHTVEFSNSKQKVNISNNTTLLELAESYNVTIESDCRAGICGQCKVKLIRGQVDMDCEDALTDQEQASSMILACQSIAKSDLIVEA